MKYIIIENELGLPMPIIFSELLDHNIVWDAIHNIYSNTKLISAGMVNIDETDTHVYGKSHTLKINSRSEDRQIIIDNLYRSI